MKRDALILLIATGVLASAAYNADVITEARLPGLEIIMETEMEDETEGLSVPELDDSTEQTAETETILSTEAVEGNGEETVSTEAIGNEEIVSTEMIGTEAVMEPETETADYVMYSSKWDEVQMSFYADGTCMFEMPAYKISEGCTWTYEEGVLSVTRADGAVFTSYIAEDTVTLKLDYHALKHELLIGQFESVDYQTFFEQ